MCTTDFSDRLVIKNYTKYLLVNKYFGKQAFLKFIGNVNGLSVLDLGCGFGHFSKDLIRLGADYTGVDKSNGLIALVDAIEKKEKLGAKFYCLNGASMKSIKSETFDKVMMFQVIMNVPNLTELKGIFKEIRRVIKPNGELVFSMLHPLLMQSYKDDFREIIMPRDSNHLHDGMQYTAKHLMTDFKWMEFKNSYWSLKLITSLLKKNGFVITDTLEPKPSKEGRFWRYFRTMDRIPQYLFVRAMYSKN